MKTGRKFLLKKIAETKEEILDALRDLSVLTRPFVIELKPFVEKVEKMTKDVENEALLLMRYNEILSGVRRRIMAVRVNNEVHADTLERLNKTFGV